MPELDVVSEEDKDKALKLLRVYLLSMQRQLLIFSDKWNTEINGLLFEIDRVIPREKSSITKGSTEGGRRKE